MLKNAGGMSDPAENLYRYDDNLVYTLRCSRFEPSSWIRSMITPLQSYWSYHSVPLNSRYIALKSKQCHKH